MKSEFTVAERVSNEFNELNLTGDTQGRVQIFQLLSSQTRLFYQRFEFDALGLGALIGETREDAHASWKRTNFLS